MTDDFRSPLESRDRPGEGDPLVAELEQLSPRPLSTGFKSELKARLAGAADVRPPDAVSSGFLQHAKMAIVGLAAAVIVLVSIAVWTIRQSSETKNNRLADNTGDSVRPGDDSNPTRTNVSIAVDESALPTWIAYHHAQKNSDTHLAHLLERHAVELFPESDPLPSFD